MDRIRLLSEIVTDIVGPDSPVAVRLPDGSQVGPSDSVATIVFRNDDALRYLVRAPGELGIARAYVSGALDVEGDVWALLALRSQVGDLRIPPRRIAELLRVLGVDAVRNPPPIPAEEIDVGSRFFGAHRRDRDATSVSHHYDVGNDFYRLVLGPSMTYSCAVFEQPTDSLEQAQANKHELICRKLGLRAGERLLDVGCGWGSLLIHAARHHGIHGLGITISSEQAALAEKRVTEAGVADRISIRLLDYRDLEGEGQFDAISSVGMFEHVGLAQRRQYLEVLRDRLGPGGRLLNHQIGRAPRALRWYQRENPRVHPRGFVHRYVFPDGELHEVGSLISEMQRLGLEVRHVESLRDHYGPTLRRWVANLETHWDEAVALTSEARARVWRLYMAGSAMMFETGGIQVHQILAVNAGLDGQSHQPLRPTW